MHDMCVFIIQQAREVLDYVSYSSRIFVYDSKFLKKIHSVHAPLSFENPFMYFSFNCR